LNLCYNELMPEDKKRKQPKVGLALSGGSALGIAHVGVIKALKENNIPVDFVSGTSAGSIAAAALAFDIPLEKMIETSKKLNWKNASKFGYSRMGWNSNEPMGEIIEEMIGKKRIENSLIPMAIIATDIDTGEKTVFKEGSVTKAIMASACIPGFYTPVKIRGKNFVDGGLVENLPLSPLKEMGAEIRIGVDLESWKKFRKTKNVLDVINNSYDILIKPQALFITRGSEIIIEPHLENFTTSDFDKFEKIMQAGYKAANLMIPEIRKQLDKKTSRFRSFMQKIANFLFFWKK
jgi:NTE family protein